MLATHCEDPEALAPDYYDHVNGNGFTAGLQLGGTYYVTRHIGINLEAGAEYTMLTVGDASYRFLYVPVTAGLRVR